MKETPVTLPPRHPDPARPAGRPARLRLRCLQWRGRRKPGPGHRGCRWSACCWPSALGGFYMVEPNQAAVLSLFGKYVGTVKDQGLRWNNPFFYAKQKISPARAQFREQQAQGQRPGRQPDRNRRGDRLAGGRLGRGGLQRRRLRKLRAHPVRVGAARDGHQLSLRPARGRPDLAAQPRRGNLQAPDRGESRSAWPMAGVQVIDARISHLAYAPEIAQAMLQRQQASAIIAARTRIVEGAVSMVEMALDRAVEAQRGRTGPGAQGAAMVSNLLVVLCGERGNAADRQRRLDLLIRRRASRRRPIRCASTPRCWMPSSTGPTTSCARLNAQIEYVLREALRKNGRLKSPPPAEPALEQQETQGDQ